ncbi:MULTISPECIES: GntR family transcriptional regulator [Paraclostridium]|uniref:GntR family transcriptional regulator n=1 Tax=Paraclostridium bifermentans TaxID=1490 RepID=A0A5P3XC36_PARBF|nr:MULTISPECIES: GntR family transcriptional regulator [Paraclostridium]KGJ48168.1 GntR family transcriptional regulator [Clostridium sp. NCR]MCU9808242.1 GntR family transcriptional regulator [Paraclostridium sp. AKS46]MDV8116029.1 GntR family transcriptional regulator [Bacillus sp. BAU-SS-2023]OXX83096.1 GntR family transcriptional regulator [Paraclostridium benzoelyticum]EQK47913.1 bacterial regulatory s, gntR family protein [[Clostridium] bifermentans ATCC 19299] [Paraclostridium biferment
MNEPIYKQIESHIKNLIQSKTLKQGELIPSEKQLSEEFNVTRMTVRSALNNLVKDGYITRQRGVGSIVLANKVYDNISAVSGFTEEMENKGYKVSNILEELNVIEADEELMNKLNLTEKENVWEIKRIRLANDKKISYMETYMPVKLFPNLKKSHCEGSLYNYVEEVCGYKIAISEREVSSVLANDELANLLDLTKPEALLYISQVCKLHNSDVFEYSHTYHYGYTLTLSAVSE